MNFPTPVAGDSSSKAKKLSIFNSFSDSVDELLPASPDDSMLAFKGSPIMESPIPGLRELLDFKDADQVLVAEAEAADARLKQAEQTLADLQSCDDAAAANALSSLDAQPDKQEVDRQLQIHLAKQQKRIAEAEAAIKRLMPTGR